MYLRSPLGFVSCLSRKMSAFRVSWPNHKAVLSSLQAHCILNILATARTAGLVIGTEPGARSQKLKSMSAGKASPACNPAALEAQANPSLQASQDTPSLNLQTPNGGQSVFKDSWSLVNILTCFLPLDLYRLMTRSYRTECIRLCGVF